MKKFLVVAALVAMVAAPAFAGLAPVPADRNLSNPQELTIGTDAGQRSAVYVQNDAAHVYDNYWAGSGLNGPDDVAYSWANYSSTTGQNFGASFQRMQLKPGATGFSSMHILANMPAGLNAPPTIPLQVAFYSTPAGSPIGTFLNTVGLNSAFFIFNIPNSGFFNLRLTFPQVVAPANRDLWFGFASAGKLRLRGGSDNFNNQFDGNLGDGGNATARYIGGGNGVFCTNSGGGLTSPSGCTTSFRTAFTSGGVPTSYLGNWHLALGGVPEPSVAMLLGLGGLVALRRRKA
jgi:hypothetical protein